MTQLCLTTYNFLSFPQVAEVPEIQSTYEVAKQSGNRNFARFKYPNLYA